MEKSTQNFLSVIEDHKGIIYKVAGLYARDGEDRKDLAQEIIFQLWRSFERYDEQYKLSTWIYRIALNVSISFYRKEKRRETISHPLSGEVFSIHEEESSQHEDVKLLQQFIKELKELDRAIIILTLDGNNQKETAEILGLTETNVSTRVGRIKTQLKKKFETAKNL
jgi:RNA polymerase sigma factor (sigma-70 family)